MLELAAQSIAKLSGVEETMVDVVHGKAFRHYGEGLRQYLTIRLRNPEAADEVLREVRAVAAARGAAELVKPPGVRAQLYGLARDLSETRLKADGVPKRQLTWRTINDVNRAAVLEAIRGSVEGTAAELLELRHARELTPEEIAHVVNLEPGEVRTRLSAAETEVAFHIEGSSWELEDAVLSAFALRRRSSNEVADEPKTDPLPEGTTVGERYKVEARVGSGSFSDVYRAQDTEVPGHTVAIKLLHQPALSAEARDTALRELHLIASVFHPSIVQFKDHGWYEGRLWFVMPWYEGETLETRIQRGPLSRAEARRIFEHLARALGAMHAAGIRHQDIKPDNIFLANLRHFGLDDEGGVLPVLLDLGVAAKEAEMVVAGTPTYFAPEVAAQFAPVPIEHPIGTKADVFSLALSLRNSLEPDTQEDVAAGAVEHFVEYRSQHTPEMPREKQLRYLHKHLQRWMSPHPDDRPTADQLVEELSLLTQPEDRRQRQRAIFKWLIPLLLGIGVAFASVVYILNQRARLQELEAEQARQERAETQAELAEESTLRQALEEDVAVIRQQYESSQLTRQDLVGRLAETEGNLSVAETELRARNRIIRSLRERVVEGQRETERVSGELATTQSSLETTRQTLASTRSSLEAERTARATLADQVSALERDLATVRGQAEAAANQVAELDRQTRTLQAEAAGARAEAAQLERQLEAANQARQQAEAALGTAQRQIAELQRQLAARSAPTAPPGTTPAAPTNPGVSTMAERVRRPAE
ncbi:MAG: protein kinase [Myxococcota bacterium]